jgi:PAS domain S-box-containing protein
MRYGIVGAVLLYATFAALWILLSDSAIAWLTRDPDQLALLSTLKGWLFVLVTSLLLYGLLQRFINAEAHPEVSHPGCGKQILPIALLAIAIVVITGASIAHTVIHQQETEAARLQAIASLKARQVADWLKERQTGDAETLHHSKHLIEQYRRWQVSGSEDAGVFLKARLEQLCRSDGFSAVSLLDPSGQVLWRTGQAPKELAPVLMEALKVAARENSVQRVGPYLGQAGNVHLDLVVPLAGPAPVVILHASPDEWLYPTLRDWPVPSDSAEILLIRRDGDQVVYLNSLRHRPGAAASFHLPVGGADLLAAQALTDKIPENTLITGSDYRNVPSIGVVHAIPGTDWHLLAKVDRAELRAPAYRSASWIGLTGLLALFMTGGSLVMLRQRQQLALAEGAREAQAERLRALNLLAAVADASEDAIFAKDIEGCYLLFNRAACRIVGKSAIEVIGNDDHAIFPPEQAEILIDAERRIVAEERTVMLEETLDTAAGSRTFQTTKGPLHDAEGKVSGVFGIARDITELKGAEFALRDSESRYRALVEQSLAGIYILQGDRIRYTNPAFAAIFCYGSPADLIDRVPFSALLSDADRATVLASMQVIVSGETADLHLAFVGQCHDGRSVGVEVYGRSFEYGGAPAVIGLVLDISARQQAEESLRRQTDELQRRNDELERFNRATVGRELEMLALKQQVNRLFERLGEPKPYPLAFLDDESDGAK